MTTEITICVRSVVWLLVTITYIQPLYGKLGVSVASLEKKAETSSDQMSPEFKQQGSMRDRSEFPSLSKVLETSSPQNYLSTGNIGLDNKNKKWPLEKLTLTHPIQSPVDLITSKAVTMEHLPALDIIETEKDNKIKAKILNSGSTVFVYINEVPSRRPYLIGGPLLESKFIFEQMHFHWGREDDWGSEHLVDGESYAVEIHLVHYNNSYGTFEEAAKQPDGLSVLTLFAEAQEEDNPLLEPLHQLLSYISRAHRVALLDALEAMQWPYSAFKINKDYYAYPGSLTTPPHTQNVVFIILPTPIKLSLYQLRAFRRLHSAQDHPILDNKRNIQPLHNRPIVRGTKLNP